MLSATDREVAQLCMDEDRVLVTNNADDFLKLAEDEGLHPGLVVMPLAARNHEQVWMRPLSTASSNEPRRRARNPPR